MKHNVNHGFICNTLHHTEYTSRITAASPAFTLFYSHPAVKMPPAVLYECGEKFLMRINGHQLSQEPPME